MPFVLEHGVSVFGQLSAANQKEDVHIGSPEINDLFGVQEARIIKFIRELSEGDPIAWGIVGLAVVVTIVSAIVKKRREGG